MDGCMGYVNKKKQQNWIHSGIVQRKAEEYSARPNEKLNT